jgi:hypothetical protein
VLRGLGVGSFSGFFSYGNGAQIITAEDIPNVNTLE